MNITVDPAFSAKMFAAAEAAVVIFAEYTVPANAGAVATAFTAYLLPVASVSNTICEPAVAWECSTGVGEGSHGNCGSCGVNAPTTPHRINRPY